MPTSGWNTIDEALVDFTAAVTLDPAYTGRAEAYMYLGDHNEAHVDVNFALDVDPMNRAALYFRGFIYLAQKEWHRAATAWEGLVERQPDAVAPYAALGDLYYIQEFYGMALEYYRGYLERAGAGADRGIAERVRLFEANNRPPRDSSGCDQTLDELDYALKTNFHDSMEEFQVAVAVYTCSLKLSPDDPDLYIDRATAYLWMEACDLAVADFEQAAQLDPNRSSAYAGLGHCYYVLGEYDAAAEAGFIHLLEELEAMLEGG